MFHIFLPHDRYFTTMDKGVADMLADGDDADVYDIPADAKVILDIDEILHFFDSFGEAGRYYAEHHCHHGRFSFSDGLLSFTSKSGAITPICRGISEIQAYTYFARSWYDDLENIYDYTHVVGDHVQFSTVADWIEDRKDRNGIE